MFSLVYETKFTARKSQEVVFAAGKRRGRWGGIRHLGGISKRCLDRTLGTATVRKHASKQALGIRGIASQINKTTAFWHVRSLSTGCREAANCWY